MDAIESILVVQKDLAANDCRSRNEHLVRHGVGGQHLELFSYMRNTHVPVFAGRIEFPIGPDGRRLERIRLGQAHHVIEGFPGARVIAADKSVVGQNVIFALV
jgi:hypothetical protein